jgi:hypothetical protein
MRQRQDPSARQNLIDPGGRHLSVQDIRNTAQRLNIRTVRPRHVVGKVPAANQAMEALEWLQTHHEDNVPLAKELLKLNIGMTGTTRKNALGYPRWLVQLKGNSKGKALEWGAMRAEVVDWYSAIKKRKRNGEPRMQEIQETRVLFYTCKYLRLYNFILIKLVMNWFMQ